MRRGERIVLAPQGLPVADDVRESCCRLLLACGADLQRVIEGDALDVRRFALHVQRFRGLASGRLPLVLLTRTSPVVDAVLRTRRALEESTPVLRKAAWVIFHDDARTWTQFLETAAALGETEPLPEGAHVWIGPEREAYLVLSSRVADPRALPARIRALETRAVATEDSAAESSVQPVARVVLAERPTMLPPAGYEDIVTMTRRTR